MKTRLFQITTDDERSWLTAWALAKLIANHDFTNNAELRVEELNIGSLEAAPILPHTFDVGRKP